ncbi:hypothetical protein ACIBKY_49565 [Nonomuraea sp. NPDC050394]|uniref:hypothetical protein n=1 Tax=Nonomuraea sp. NPDC050394 TaxID=3364363 RepID=UPI0037A422A7
MTSRVLLASLAAGALAVPVPVANAASEPAIREITIRPADPVVGPTGSVRLVIEVIAQGVDGRDGVTVKVDPGAPPDGVPAPPVEPVDPPPVDPPPVSPPPLPTPTVVPSVAPSAVPSALPSAVPSVAPSVAPSAVPSGLPSVAPSALPSAVPSAAPSVLPSVAPSQVPPLPAPPPLAPGLAVPGQAPRWHGEQAGAMRRGDGWQTWRFLPEKGLTRYYPSGTWTIVATATGPDGRSVTAYKTFKLRKETRLTSVQATKVAGTKAVRLRGVLTRVDPMGFTDYSPFGNQRMEILHRRDEKSPWRQEAVATTSELGKFGKTVLGPARGQWRARFPGTGHYAAEVSSVEHIGDRS